MHTCLCGHTIDDIKWVIVVQGSHTTDTYCCCTRGVTIGSNIHARHTSLKSLHRVVLVLLRHFIDTNSRDSSRQVGLALSGITCHHHFLQHFGIILECHFHTLMGSGFLCLIANVRDNEDSPLVYFNREVTVEIGNRTVRRTLLHHRSSDDRFA